MTVWLQRVLAPVAATHTGVAVVLDPDGLVDVAALDGDVIHAADWWALRAAYEVHGRHRPVEAGRLALVVLGGCASEPLPWDIERSAAIVVSVRLPGPPIVRAMLAELGDDERDRVIQAVAGVTDAAAAALSCITGVAISARPLSRAEQLRVASQLAVRSRRSANLVALAQRWVVDPAVVGLLNDPPDAMAVHAEWAGFIKGHESTWGADFEAARAELGQLFAGGLMRPVAAPAGAHAWTAVGVRQPTHEERAANLLAERPSPFPPNDHKGWVAVAEWWGDVRRLTAGAAPELRESAWSAWFEMDAAFLPWLRARYGTVLSSAARWPSAVHRVASFLARRFRDGMTERVLLVVLDGLGHAQWAHLRERLGWTVVEGGSTFALVPTYTTISRQAIFAGDLPLTYAESLWTTQPERRRWQAFWGAQGLQPSDVTWQRVKGRLPHDHVNFGMARAMGVVVNAVDDLMHTSELFGDAQFLANLDIWVANGFLDDLVSRANGAGFEVWITADHGNLECLPTPPPREGVAIESAGKRLLRYPNHVLRDASKVEGIVWDHIPGMPASAEPLRFAPGRFAYTNNQLSISHGGLSLDEVVVPLVRVKP